MLIPTVGCCQQWMPLLVVKQYQGTAPEDRTQASDQPPGNEHVGVDGLAMRINVAGQKPGLLSCLISRVPHLRGPACQGIGQAFSPTSMGHLRQKGFGVAVPIRSCASGQQG